MATVGNLTGYEPTATPGAYNFLTKDGRKLTAFGAQAEAMKARLDQANAAGPQPTAQASALAEPPHPLAAGLAAASPMAAAVVRGATRSPVATDAPKQPVAGAAPPPAPAAAPPPAPPKPPEEQAPATGLKDLGLGYAQDPQTGLILEYDPGSPGSRGGPVERGRTIRGGFEEDPAYKAAKWELTQAGLGELDRARAEQAEAFEAEQTLLQDQRVMQNDALMEDQKRAHDIEDGVKRAEQQREAALKEYTSAKVDPRRALAGGKNWLYALAAGLGTFGAGLSKTPNYSVQVLQQRIADDISAQEKEIAIKRDAADNALADLTRKLGSQERAKIALAQVQNQLVQNSLAQHASRTKDAESRSRTEQMRLQMQEQFLNLTEQDRRLAAGEVTTSIVNQPAQAPRAPGWRPAGNQLGTAKAIADLRNAEAGGAGKAPSPVPSERTNKIALNAQVIEDSTEVLGLLPEGGSEWDDPTGGPLDALEQERKNKLDQATGRLASGVQIAGGFGSSDDDRKNAGAQAGEGGSTNERRRAAQAEQERAAQRIAVEISTLPPEQQAQAFEALSPAARAAVVKAAQKGRRQ